MRTEDLAIQQVAKRQHGAISWRQLVELGVTRSQVRRRVRKGEWIKELAGVWRLSWSEPSWMQKAWCAWLWGGPDAVLSHRTAARLWELDGIGFEAAELTAPRRRRPRVAWLVAHWTTAFSRQMQRTRKGLALTSPARTLVDLAGVVDEDTLERTMEDALRRRIATASEVRRVLRYLPASGRAGTGTIARLLKRMTWSEGAQSELERRALEMFRSSGLPMPQCQYMVLEGERCLGTVDFAWPRAKVIVEAEGFQFHSGREAWESDISRYNALSLHGWTVVRLTQADLLGRAGAFARALAKALARRGAGQRTRQPG